MYQIKIDNNNDAVEDIVFRFRLQTRQRLLGLFTTMAGISGGAVALSNSPAPLAPGTGLALANADGSPFCAVPANAGARTMDYADSGSTSALHLTRSTSAHSTAAFPAFSRGAEDSASSNAASDTVSG